ncbi:MAG: cytochrome c biogenesis protein CcsA [Planctomycetota bacterium]
MLATLREISVTCFAASYIIVLALELFRLVGRIPGRGIAVIVMTALGLFTHITYLTLRAVEDAAGSGGARLASWTDWSLMLALVLAVCFAVLYLSRPDTVISFFFLPAILLLIGLSIGLRGQPPFSRTEAFEIWRLLHILGMAVGSSVVTVGFLTGVMYLAQSWRLKRKRAGSSLRLPTLETLQRLSRVSLLVSTIAVGIGVVSGAVMNLNRWGVVGWTDGGVIFSAALFFWLVFASGVEMFYAPMRRGRKIAYLILASFAFLVAAMAGALMTSHGTRGPKDAAASEALSSVRQSLAFTEARPL